MSGFIVLMTAFSYKYRIKEVKTMSLLIAGAISAVMGLIGLMAWWNDFLAIIRGAVPLAMVLGGILAVYVGYDDIQDKMREEQLRQDAKLEKAREEIEVVRAKAEQYKEELERLKVHVKSSEDA
jgi:flagellar motor component MotA